MHLYMKREQPINNATPGKLFIDGEFICYTLEDLVRDGIKIDGETAIPAGQYFICMNMSPHFGRILPQIMNVPGFEGIRIHRGNTDKDTSGCILVGFKRELDKIWESANAESYLVKELLEASHKQILAITIENA